MLLDWPAGDLDSLSSIQYTEGTLSAAVFSKRQKWSHLLCALIRCQIQPKRGIRIMIMSWNREMISCRDQDCEEACLESMAGFSWLD